MINRSLSEGILTLQLDHGKANALDIELLEALDRELASVESDVRAVILTGTGTIFSAGVDLVRLVDEGPEYVRNFFPALCRCLRNLFAFPKPIVTAVNGHAIAGGCIMALSADFRLMADGKGKIGISELLVGVPFPMAALEILRFALPSQYAQSLIYSGKSVTPQEALHFGMIDELTPADSIGIRALECARQLAAIPAEAFSMTKRSLRASTLARIDAGAGYDNDACAVWMSADTHAIIRQFLQRTLRK